MSSSPGSSPKQHIRLCLNPTVVNDVWFCEALLPARQGHSQGSGFSIFPSMINSTHSLWTRDDKSNRRGANQPWATSLTLSVRPYWVTYTWRLELLCRCYIPWYDDCIGVSMLHVLSMPVWRLTVCSMFGITILQVSSISFRAFRFHILILRIGRHTFTTCIMVKIA